MFGILSIPTGFYFLPFYTMTNIETFVDQLLAEKQIEESPDVRAQIRADLIDTLEDRINAMILAALEEEDLEAFEDLLTSGTSEEVQVFVKKHIVDIDERVAIELLTFRDKYLG